MWIYRSARGAAAVRRWCERTLADRPVCADTGHPLPYERPACVLDAMTEQTHGRPAGAGGNARSCAADTMRGRPGRPAPSALVVPRRDSHPHGARGSRMDAR
jgi:hypothetical protein